MVGELGGGRDGGARVLDGVLLLDGDGGQDAVDLVDVRPVDALQELPHVGRHRLDEPPLPLGVERVERQRRLSRTRRAGHHRQLPLRDVDRNVLEIVGPRPADGDGAIGHVKVRTVPRSICHPGTGTGPKRLEVMTIFLTLLLLAGPAPTKAVPEPIATVPLKLIGGKATVSVTVNGKGPFDFFLDTGAGMTVLDSDLAEELQLPVTGTTRIGDPANPQAIEAKTATVKRLTIGSAVFQDVEVVTWDRSGLYGGTGPRGVIGNPLFADYLLTLDLGKGEARIARGEVAPGPDVVSYEPSEGGIFRIPVSIGNLNIEAAIDSGSPSGFALPKRYAEQLPLATPLTETGRGRTANSEFVLSSAAVDATARIGINTFARPVVTFNDVLPGALFGSQILRQMVMTIDQKNRRIRLTPGAPAPAPVKVAVGAVSDYAGRFGIRTITSRDGDLFLQRDGGPMLKLVAAGNEEFTIEGIPAARVRFTRTAAGKVTSLEVLNPAGQWEKAPRDNE